MEEFAPQMEDRCLALVLLDSQGKIVRMMIGHAVKARVKMVGNAGIF